jgi:hypothetical protein
MMMKHMVQRSISFIALTGMLACTGDPTGDFANGVDHLEATPTTLFIVEGTPENVVVTARDASNNPVTANFTIASVTGDISVERDVNFEPVRNSDGELEPNTHPIRVRYLVTPTTSTGTGAFTISAGGETIDISVRTTPTTLNVLTLSNASPALGDTVTITAPAPYKFTPASTITLTGAASVKVSTSADSTQIRFLAGPNADGPVSVTGAVLSYAPTIATFTVTSALAFTTPALSNFGSVSTTAATTGDTVTLTITPGSGLRFRPSSVVTIGGRPTIRRSISADSLTMRVSPAFGAAANVSVTNVILTFLPAVALNLTSTNQIAVTGTRYAGTDDPSTAPTIVLPAVGDSVEFFDRWDATVLDQFYTFTVASVGSYTFTTDWDGSADVDALRCPSTSPGCTAGIASLGATAAHPETATVTLGSTAGNTGLQKLWINLYDGGAPTFIRIKIKRNS